MAPDPRRGGRLTVCGRYTVSSPSDLVADYFGLDETPTLAARYNVAPTQEAPIVVAGRDGQRRLGPARWGLVPFWADDPSIGNRMINARSETAATKPAFRRAWQRRRCLVVADGFYEWQKTTPKSPKQPYLFRLADDPVFGFAGLWERWGDGDDSVISFTILTTRPNELVAPIHDRMPVIVPREDHDRWLARDAGAGELERLAAPIAARRMIAWPVSTVVNSPANEDARCIEPIGPPLG